MSTASKLLLCFWLSAVLFLMSSAESYENTPGSPSHTAYEWPDQAPFKHSLNQYTLTMLLHPRCNCSKASLEELKQIIAEFPNQVESHLLFRSEISEKDSIMKEALWSEARSIPGIHMHFDAQGEIAKLFGATTSGHVAMYDSKGHLVFAGGITRARGQVGNSLGSASLKQILNHQSPLTNKTVTFGCPLHNKDGTNGA